MRDRGGERDGQHHGADREQRLGECLHHAAAAPPGGGPAGRSAGTVRSILSTRPHVPHVSMYAGRPVPHFGQTTAASRPQTGQRVVPGGRISWSKAQYGSPGGYTGAPSRSSAGRGSGSTYGIRARGLLTVYTNQPRTRRVTIGPTTPISRKTGIRSTSAFQSGMRIGVRKSMNPWNSRPRASNTIEILAGSGRSWRSRRTSLADRRPGGPSLTRGRGHAVDEPRRALDAGAVATCVIAHLAVVGHDDHRPRTGRPESAQGLGDPIPDHLVRGGVTAERHREPGRDAAAGATAGMAVEDQLDLIRWPECSPQPGDQRCRRQPGAPATDATRERELDVSAVDQDPARASNGLAPATNGRPRDGLPPLGRPTTPARRHAPQLQRGSGARCSTIRLASRSGASMPMRWATPGRRTSRAPATSPAILSAAARVPLVSRSPITTSVGTAIEPSRAAAGGSG